LVLACFNQHNKISADTFARWCAVLQSQPSSVLWLTDPGNAHRQTLLQAAASHGIAAERLYWAARLPLAQHVERIACADLVLDSHPFTMHATAVNALAAGVPFLTYCGDNALGRVSASLLHTAGLGDCVCANAQDYVRRMVALVQDDKAREQLRQRFVAARNTSKLFDCAAFASYLEEAYDKAYARWLAGLQPADIKIERRTVISA
jgi:predicted O-linked N-acetylglucosamine transferase (SPINDLY family)